MRLPHSGWNGCLFIGSLFAAYFSRCLRWRLSYVAFPRFIRGLFTNKSHRKSRGISYSGKSLRSHFCLYVNIFSSLSQLCDLLRREIESLPCFIRPAASRPIHQRTLRAIFPGIRTNARFGGSQRLWWGTAACLAFFAVCRFAVFVMICINWWSAS